MACQDQVSGFGRSVGFRGSGWKGKGPDTLRADASSSEEARGVEGMGTHGEKAVFPGMEVEAADMTAGAARAFPIAKVARGGGPPGPEKDSPGHMISTGQGPGEPVSRSISETISP